MAKVLLEVCCASVEDAVTAQSAGADRVELCSALEVEGLTPSAAAIIQAKSRLSIPYVCMIRPRPGGFSYSATEFRIMQQDAQFALEHGASGIVFGLLNTDRSVDVQFCRALVETARGRETVFHRAFELVPDPLQALDALIEIGITRVLTSGQQNTAGEGADLIRTLIEHARGRIEILPAGNIRPENVRDVVGGTGCRQVHLAARKSCKDSSVSDLSEGVRGRSAIWRQAEHQVTDPDLIARMVRALRD